MMKARKFDKDFRVLLGMRNMLVTVFYFQMSVEKKRASVIFTGVFSNMAIFRVLTRLKQSLDYFKKTILQKNYATATEDGLILTGSLKALR